MPSGMISISDNKNKALFCVFLFGVFAASLSQLRVGYVGLGETLILLSVIYFFSTNFKNLNFRSYKFSQIVIGFWLTNFFLLLLAWFFVGQENYKPINLVAYSSSALILALIVSVSSIIFFESSVRRESLVQTVSNFSACFSYFLFLIFLASILLRVESLWFEFGFRFRALSVNPNQLAFILLMLPYFLVIELYENCTVSQNHAKTLALSLAILCCLLCGVFTSSLALELTWLLTLPPLFGVLLAIRGLNIRFIIYSVLLIFLFLVFKQWLSLMIVFQDLGYGALSLKSEYSEIGWLLKIDKELMQHEMSMEKVRLTLIEVGIVALMESSFLGYGPGVFSGLTDTLQGKEVHVTLIDWTLMSGVLGGFVFIVLGTYIFFKFIVLGKFELLIPLLALAMFSCAHTLYRHPLFWFFVSFFIFLANSETESSKTQGSQT